MDVRIPKDIRKYKDKLIGGFTIRQAVSLVVAIGVIPPVWYYLYKLNISMDTIGWLVVAISIPVFSIGWLDIHGMPIEKYIANIFVYNYIYPTKRLYKNSLEMEEYFNVSEKRREKELKLSKRRRKQ